MNGSAWREALRRDLPLNVAWFLYLGIFALYFLPSIDFYLREEIAWYYLLPAILGVVIWSVQFRLRSEESRTGQRFWNYFSLALLLWIAGAVAESQLLELRDAVLGPLFVDCLYTSYYLTLVFATEIRPDLGAASPRQREQELNRGSTVSFILALLFYCSVIPSQRNPEAYLSGRFSLILYLCLEIFFLARFAYLAGAARSPRWRLVYRLLFAAYGASVVLLIAQLHANISVSSPLPPWVGTKWDLLWHVSAIPLILAARVSRYVTEKPLPLPVKTEPALRFWEPIALYAIAFPLLHLLLDASGQLDGPSRSVQQGLVIIYFVFFGLLALAHSHFREKKRLQAERAVRESEMRYRQLIESHPDAILIEQEGRLVYVNSTGAKKLNVDGSGAGRSLAAMGFPGPPAQRANTVIPVECRVPGRGGEEIDLEVSYFEISYLGRPALQAIARDVTEVKRHRAESERMARLASLGQFSAAMAHEIRNPLAAIVMHSFFLAERLAKDDENLRTLADINAAVDRMQKLVSGILSFVRPLELHLAEEDLVAVVDSARLDLARRIDMSKIVFENDYAHHDATVEVDVSQMLAVFTNVLENALRAMPDGGTLTVRTSHPSGERIEIVIEDTGVGIDDDDLQRIFEPFFTRRDDGVGLGLALAARVLDQHACRYRVESASGKGTRFILDFALLGGGSKVMPTLEESRSTIQLD